MTDYPEVQDYLFGLKAKGVKYGIDRMRGLARELGHPERKIPIIHLAGTNGKGSTAAMLDSILRQAGYRVGLYTSPHLVRLGERVQVDRVELTETEIVNYTRELRPIAESLAAGDDSDHPSFFEFMTAMAFLQFERKQCDIAVVEVGLGGELDATNVVQPTVTAITSIGLDHCEILGDTHAEIAVAKAGIIKTGIPVVMGRLPEEAEQVVRAKAAQMDAPVISVRDRFGENTDEYPTAGMFGDCQRWNAGTAQLIVEALAWGISPQHIEAGLGTAHWPARWQEINWAGRRVILDTSHNPEGAVELDHNLTRLAQEAGGPLTIVVGALGSNRAGPLLEIVGRYAACVCLVEPQQRRACSHAELRQLLPIEFSGKLVESQVDKLFSEKEIIQIVEPQQTIVVTGSIYLAGEVLAALDSTSGAPESHLQDF